jgi:hypothetical protein
VKKGFWTFVIAFCVLLACLVWGQAQRIKPTGPQPAIAATAASREYNEMKRELEQLKAEFARLTQFIKVVGQESIRIEATSIHLKSQSVTIGETDGTLRLANGNVYLTNAAYVYGTVWAKGGFTVWK